MNREEGERAVGWMLIATYVISGFLTFGVVQNGWKDCADDYNCSVSRDAGSILAGALWPLYLMGKVAIWATDWENDDAGT